MDPINTIAGNPESTPQTSTSHQPQHNPEKKDSNSLTVASVAIFVILSLGIIVFLYYQNQQLKSMLASYQTPVASPTPTIDPGLKPEPQPDESVTANWKTYTSTDYRFTFKYPQIWKIKESFDKANVDLKFAYTSKGVLMLYVVDDKSEDVIYIHPELPTTCNIVTSSGNKTISGRSVNYCNYGQSSTHYYNFGFVKLPNFSIDTYKTSTTIDQVLSTFKFTEAPNASPNATPKASLIPTPTY